MKTVLCWLAGWFALSLYFAAEPVAAQTDVPEVVRERLGEGDRHRQAGRFGAALDSYLEARRLGPGVLEVYASLGALYVGQDELEKALEAFGAGLEIEPDDRQLLFNAAVVAMRLERFDAALGHVERALQRHRGDGDLHSLRGAILTRLERPEDALAALETAAERKPSDPQIQFRLGNLHHQLGQKDLAVDAFRKAIKKDRDLLRAHYNLGAVLFELGRFDEALDAYVTALAPLEKAFAAGETVDPVHARAYQNLGAIYFRQEDWRRALDAYDKALKLEADLPGALYNQGFIHFTLGDSEAAEQTYSRALELDTELPLAYYHLGRIRQQRGELESAIEILTKGLPKQSGEARLDSWRTLAYCQDRLGRVAEAEMAYRAVLETVPDDLMVRLSLGRALRRAGRIDEARQELEEVRRLAPDHAAAGLELAVLARSQGRTEDEKALYEELLEADDGDEMWPVKLNLALLLLRQGRMSEARPHLEVLTRLKGSGKRQEATGLPGVAERQLIATIHGLLLALDGDLPAARKRLQSVLAEDEDFSPATDVLAVLDAVTNPKDATQALAEALNRHQGDVLESIARANLGQALWLAGLPEDAREHLEAAGAAYPHWLSLKAALGDLALTEKRYGDATTQLAAAIKLCGSSEPSLIPEGPEGFFSTAIGGRESYEPLCERIWVSLGLARLGLALERLDSAVSTGVGIGAIRELADRALGSGLRPEPEAVALFLRGTTRLAQGANDLATRDLALALASELPAALRPRANNNLGIAWTRLGRLEEARAAFEAAIPAFVEAYLNLGILLDDHVGDPRGALERYRAYREAGGSRRDVMMWIERLEKFYR